jgi:GxxExxY protein
MMSAGTSIDKITERIIGCSIRVHQALGPGFLENIYRRALMIELSSRGLFTEFEKEIPVYYREREVGKHRLDCLVEHVVVVELKTVERLSEAHYAQVRSYLKAAELEIALLINFSSESLDYRRIHVRIPRKLLEV